MHEKIAAYIDFFVALTFAGIASLIQDTSNHLHQIPYFLHFIMQCAKAFMYVGSGIAGFVGGYKLIHSWFKGRKDQ